MRPTTLLFLLLAPSLLAAPCDLNVRATPADDPKSIVWDHYIGAQAYRVTESRDDFTTTRTYLASKESFTIPHKVSEETRYWYRVDALFDPTVQIDGACTGFTDFVLKPDPEFRRMTRRVIVPIAGSTTGANSARFRTSLRLTSTTASQHGRIVFHPAGQARVTDPSIGYEFTGLRQTLAWDDIVAAMGTTGIGSLDIIPDEDAAPAPPIVLTRQFTDSGSGTYGEFQSAVAPFDFLSPSGFTVVVPDTHFRVNLGFRTLTATTVQALIYTLGGQLRALKTASYPADYFTLIPASQLLGDVAPGETFTLSFDGSVIPFYTLTDNGTNDPAVVIPRPTSSKFVQ